MEENSLKTIAGQLRKPEGSHAKDVAEKMNESNKYINQYTIEALEVQPHDHILEIGMGNGHHVKDILRNNKDIKYYGCDYSHDMVQEAEKRNQEYIKTGQAQFFYAQADNLSFEKDSFDKICTVNTVYFWDDPDKTLQEFKRVLKKEGKLIISLRPKAIMQTYPFTKFGFNMFSKNNITNLLVKNKYRVVRTLEIEEPDQKMGDQKMKVASLVITAQKA